MVKITIRFTQVFAYSDIEVVHYIDDESEVSTERDLLIIPLKGAWIIYPMRHIWSVTAEDVPDDQAE